MSDSMTASAEETLQQARYMASTINFLLGQKNYGPALAEAQRLRMFLAQMTVPENVEPQERQRLLAERDQELSTIDHVIAQLTANSLPGAPESAASIVPTVVALVVVVVGVLIALGLYNSFVLEPRKAAEKAAAEVQAKKELAEREARRIDEFITKARQGGSLGRMAVESLLTSLGASSFDVSELGSGYVVTFAIEASATNFNNIVEVETSCRSKARSAISRFGVAMARCGVTEARVTVQANVRGQFGGTRQRVLERSSLSVASLGVASQALTDRLDETLVGQNLRVTETHWNEVRVTTQRYPSMPRRRF